MRKRFKNLQMINGIFANVVRKILLITIVNVKFVIAQVEIIQVILILKISQRLLNHFVQSTDCWNLHLKYKNKKSIEMKSMQNYWNAIMINEGV